MTSEINVVVEWPFPENGAERIDIASVQGGSCGLKCVLKSYVKMRREQLEYDFF